jgi:hypothetical protein
MLTHRRRQCSSWPAPSPSIHADAGQLQISHTSHADAAARVRFAQVNARASSQAKLNLTQIHASRFRVIMLLKYSA